MPKEEKSRKLKIYYINLGLFFIMVVMIQVITGETIASVSVPLATALGILFGIYSAGNVGEHFAKKGGSQNGVKKLPVE